MSWCIGILRSKNRRNTINPAFTSSNLHLFVELRRLGEEAFSLKIWHAKYIGTTFGSGSYKRRWMEQYEVILLHVVSERNLYCASDFAD